MGTNNFNFDTSSYAPGGFGGGSYEAGKYPVVIKSVELGAIDGGKGGKATIKTEIIDGPRKGGQWTFTLNLWYQSGDNADTVQRIAREQLAAIQAVTGLRGSQDPNALVGKRMVIELSYNEKAEKYKNDVVGVFDMKGNRPGESGSGKAPASKSPPKAPPPEQNGGDWGNDDDTSGGDEWGSGSGGSDTSGGDDAAPWA